jgi:hypothetical protein
MSVESLVVRKRDGTTQCFLRHKYDASVRRMTYGLPSLCVDTHIIGPVIEQCVPGISTTEIGRLTEAQTLQQREVCSHYRTIAGRMMVKRLHKNTAKLPFSEAVHMAECGNIALLAFVDANQEVLDSSIIHARDFELPLGLIGAMEETLLRREDGRIIERPQHLIMRNACARHMYDVQAAVKCYNEGPDCITLPSHGRVLTK